MSRRKATGKIIRVYTFKTGRIERYAYYNDLRAVACARALLEQSSLGWINAPTKKLSIVDRYYLRSIIPARRAKSGKTRG